MYFDAAEAEVVDVEEVMAMAVVRGRREVVQQHWLEEASISLVVVVLVVEKCPTDYGAAIEDLVSESSRSRERRRPRPITRCSAVVVVVVVVRFEVECVSRSSSALLLLMVSIND